MAGLVWRDAGKVVQNPPRPLLQDLDQFPYPDRTSLPIDYIESLPLDVPAVLSLDKFCTVQTSRGCPYSCIYCDIPSLGEGRWRSRSPEHVLGELQQLNDEGYRSLYLTDDHFLINRKRISGICQGIIDRKLQFKWGCEGRADAVGIDQLPLMKQARCDFLAFGVEAGTQKVLDRLKKKQTPAQVERAVSEAKRQGIARVHGFFVVGSPDETEADIKESFRFAARLELDTFGFNRLCAYRGTPLWQEYVDRGIIDDERDWHKWFKCSDIDPTTLPSAVVNRLRAKGYGSLFARRILKRPDPNGEAAPRLWPPHEDHRHHQVAEQPFPPAHVDPQTRAAGPDAGFGPRRAGPAHGFACGPATGRLNRNSRSAHMPPETRKNGPKGPRILIVDDDPGQRSLLDSFLRSQGFETVPVASGEQALETLRAGDISMMISDVRMPGLSGLETLRLARKEHAVLPILLVTAYADIREAVGAMRDGALNYLAKPIDLDELLATVQQATGIAKPAPAEVQRRQAIARRTWWPRARSCRPSSTTRR